jgi:hypothetical protein
MPAFFSQFMTPPRLSYPDSLMISGTNTIRLAKDSTSLRTNGVILPSA